MEGTMKISVEKDELQKRLSNIQNIVEKKNTMPILNHFLLDVSNEGNYITATDLETAFMEPIIADIAEEGRMCIPARKLFEIVKEMEGQITIESKDYQWLKVRSGKSLFRIACLSADEFPVWPSIESTGEMEMQASMLLEMIDRSLYAAGESDTRYVLNGLLFHIKPDGTHTVVGTDGHRLALIQTRLPDSSSSLKEEKKAILSRKSVAELRRLLSEESPAINMTIGKNHILFNIGNTRFLTRLIEGTYPNYEQVIPENNPKILTADRSTLIRSLRRVSIMSKERSSAVKVDIENGKAVVSATNPDLGEATDEIAVDYAGDQMTIALNARYILDALNVMTSANVLIRLNEPLSPVLLMEDGREDYKCVVMPMRL
jgi:DNA polymerase-3 subunit beta